MGFNREVTINAPIEQVFQVITRYEYAVKKLNHVLDIKIENEALQVGDHIIETRSVSGQNIQNAWEVIQCESNKRFVVKSEQNKLFLTYDYTFSEVDQGTMVSFTGNIKTSGVRNLIYKPLIKRIIIKEDGEHLNYVKSYIEELKDLNEEA
ncbi:SRPBCC family protein [Alkalibacillus silvisoli]|uniref:Activator of Hsp90 ATPase homologue 1/2-like C-terminal domain-containing protein n=1 Tax=Alkalibacillus silvisoli TaxID=392823 RepID=A0ABP3JXK1_9BACI